MRIQTKHHLCSLEKTRVYFFQEKDTFSRTTNYGMSNFSTEYLNFRIQGKCRKKKQKRAYL